MTDIVERLRGRGDTFELPSDIMNEAADEIERLRNVQQKLDEIIERIKKLGI